MGAVMLEVQLTAVLAVSGKGLKDNVLYSQYRKNHSQHASHYSCIPSLMPP